MTKPQKNMYQDAFVWNPFKGCEFDCVYCVPSFQRQAKRQMHNCMACYNYIPHFHEERLKKSLPKTTGDQFIWACSSGDISFAKPVWINKVLDVMRMDKNAMKTFFMQSKDPICFEQYDLPENLIIGITLETNRDTKEFSKAPRPAQRVLDFYELEHKRKFITIEPIMEFDYWILYNMVYDIDPDRVYIGYDTKKCKLPEPSLAKTMKLIEELEKFTIVKPKLMREKWNET